MKNAKLLCIALALVFTVLSMNACRSEGTETVSETEAVYDVTFANTSMEKQTVRAGTELQQPQDPVKDGCVFGGWYSDSGLSQAVSFPYTVNGNVTLYAGFFDYREAFAKARENTIGEDVAGYKYTYSLDMTVSYNAVNLKGSTEGNAVYSTAGDVSFYDEHTNSGLLFADGSAYQIRRGTTLQKVSVDKNGKTKSFSSEEVGNDYKYDASSFAKAVFTYSDDQLKSVTPTDRKDEYKLKTALNASSVISLVGNHVNDRIVAQLVAELPETAVDTGMYVTFAAGKIASYRYEMKVNVTACSLSLVYTLTFTDSGHAETIVPKEFTDVSISPDAITKLKNEAVGALDAYKKAERSGYDFKVKTAVDFGATVNEIDAAFKGSAFRKINGSDVYFHNDIEIDSDLKNKDLYKSAGVEDVHVKLTRLANGEVHLIEKKVLADNTQQVTDFTAGDDTSFYLLDMLSHCGDFAYAQEYADGSEVTYTFGLTRNGLASAIQWLNDALNLDPLGTASRQVTVYGTVDAASVTVKTGVLTVTLKNGTFERMEVKAEGRAIVSYPGSADFGTSKDAQIKLEYEVITNEKGASFEPYETVKKAK